MDYFDQKKLLRIFNFQMKIFKVRHVYIVERYLGRSYFAAKL